MKEVSSDKFASAIARILDDKQGKDIKILNISNISVLADYFVICSSESSTHVKALTGSVREKVKEFFEFPSEKKMTIKTAGIYWITAMLLFIFFIVKNGKLMHLKDFGTMLSVWRKANGSKNLKNFRIINKGVIYEKIKFTFSFITYI